MAIIKKSSPDTAVCYFCQSNLPSTLFDSQDRAYQSTLAPCRRCKTSEDVCSAPTGAETIISPASRIASALLAQLIYYCILVIYLESPQYGVPTDTIPLPDSSPFWSAPTDHQLVLPSISPINPVSIHKSDDNKPYLSLLLLSLIFLLSLPYAPFYCPTLGRPDSGLPFATYNLPINNQVIYNLVCILPAFSLSDIYRCVTRSCYKVISKNLT